MGWKVLELFSGLGGWRYALGVQGTVAAAYDISPWANATYALNHGERPFARELASVPAEQILAHGADTWLMSPPCQPFCRMGNRQGLEDSRSRAFLRLMQLLEEAPPVHLVLENVAGFLGSDAHDRLSLALDRHGFHRQEFTLCPTQFGIPNQRPRAFVVASQRPLRTDHPPHLSLGTIAPYLDEQEDPSLYLESAPLLRHKPGLDLVRPEDRRTACFIGGYGERFVGSGSFLVTECGIRRFSPSEVARFLGLPASLKFPAELPLSKRYKLLGNGLSIPVAAWALRLLGD